MFRNVLVAFMLMFSMTMVVVAAVLPSPPPHTSVEASVPECRLCGQ